MYSLWDTLPLDIQLYIVQIASTTLIQKTFRKNRNWHFRRIAAIKRKNPDFAGKHYRSGDRVLIIRKDRTLQYGTVNSISSHHHTEVQYYCSVVVGNQRPQYYYKKERNECQQKDIIFMCVLKSWNYCCCGLLNHPNFNVLCDMCVIKQMRHG